MKSESIEWRSGKVTYWDLDSLDPGKPLSEQFDELKEDLAQVRFPGDVVLDVGWYPESSLDGSFSVRIVHDSDWDTLLFVEESASVAELLTCLPRAIAAAEAAGRSAN
jgi:hypothetical protein